MLIIINENNMLQEIIIAAFFISALGYVIYIVRKNFIAKESNCSKGCSCSNIDLDKIEKEINADKSKKLL